MKVKFDSFEIEIEAKGVYSTEKYNEDDTLALLNYISILCHEAGEWNKEHGYNAKTYRENGEALYRFCESKGFYEKE